jgi:hypothetical protein
MAYLDDIKLYKTTLNLDEVVTPEDLPAAGNDGENTEGRSPVVWHPLEDGVYCTMWKEYASKFNSSNDSKFVAADADDAKKVAAAWKHIVDANISREVVHQYTQVDLAVPDDATKTAIAKIKTDKVAELSWMWAV